MAGIAVYAATVATKGLTTWNRQLKGGVEYDLARRILKCTYRLREAFKGVRNPVMFPNEMPTVPEDVARPLSVEQKRHYGRAAAYQNRLQKVVDVRDELRTELLEAEALWGDDILSKFSALFSLQNELFTTVHSYVTACDPDENLELRRACEAAHAKNRHILYHTYSDEKSDRFHVEVKAAIEIIENFVKPHLLKT